jgi:hypothetical protein
MSEIYVRTALSRRGGLPLPAASPDTSLGVRLAVGSTATTSSALTAGLYYIGNSVACYLAIGQNPTATTGATNLPLFGPATFTIAIKSGHKISVIRDATDGYLWIVPARSS